MTNETPGQVPDGKKSRRAVWKVEVRPFYVTSPVDVTVEQMKKLMEDRFSDLYTKGIEIHGDVLVITLDHIGDD
jgi:hypothetical protein